ncbi:hypothetical protein VTN02DRAFT_3875 [Thermoascus thermophilus]
MNDDEFELRDRSSSDTQTGSETSQTTPTPAGQANGGEAGERAEPPPDPPILQPAVTAVRRVKTWWSTYIQPTIQEHNGASRDHYSLERTYLAYIRTSNVVASFGTLTIQLFILQLRRNRANPTARALFTAGKALAVLDGALAIMTVVVGTWRYFVTQRMLQRKRIQSRGPGLLVLGATALVVSPVPCNRFGPDVDCSRADERLD